MAHWVRLPERMHQRSMVEVGGGCNLVASWHPLPRSFRSAAATRRGAVLLETAKFDGENFRSFLFFEPEIELTAWTEHEVGGVFAAIGKYLKQGRFVAGFVSYGCGAMLNGISPIRSEAAKEMPFIRMGVFHFRRFSTSNGHRQRQ